MRIGIFSVRAFDRRLARLAASISSGVKQGGGGRICPPSGARSAKYPSSGARVMKLSEYDKVISAYKTYISFFISMFYMFFYNDIEASPLYVNGQKINSVMFTMAQAYLSGIISYRTVVDNSSKSLHWITPRKVI